MRMALAVLIALAVLVALVVSPAATVAADDDGDDSRDSARGTHGIEILADWQPLPAVAARATAAAGDAVDLEGMAWGDTARGCYITVQSVATPGAKSDAKLHAALRERMAGGGASISEWSSDGHTESSFAFEAGPMRGTVRTLAADIDGMLRATTAACFYNRQYADWCATRCAELINQLEVAP